MGNLSIYEAVRTVPKEALKPIQAGRLKGKTDINPMWRLKRLTEQFGPCGIGWKYVITKQWLEHGGDDEISAFVNIDLFIKVNGEWSDAIPGTGGSSFVTKESKGLYTSDECFKMALTDAISVSCKALGFAADVYWNTDSSKYDKQANPDTPPSNTQSTQTKPGQSNEKDQVLDLVKKYAKGAGMKPSDLNSFIAEKYNGKKYSELNANEKSQVLAHLKALQPGA